MHASTAVRMAAQAVDIEIQAKEIMFHKANLNRIMAECTGQPVEQARARWPFAAPADVPPVLVHCRLSVATGCSRRAVLPEHTTGNCGVTDGSF